MIIVVEYNIKKAIIESYKKLLHYGQELSTERWQGDKPLDEFIEVLNFVFQSKIPEKIEEAKKLIDPILPWADEHFEERISGIPYNPPPSSERWNNINKTEKWYSKEYKDKFSHTYPERLWFKKVFPKGLRYDTGDLYDIVKLLAKEPNTRQCYMPMFIHEDITAALKEERVPCSLGWHFIQRNGYLHVNYFLRSVDAVRHFRNDIYFAVRKVYYILEEASKLNSFFKDVKPGFIHIFITSFHCFKSDRYYLEKYIEKEEREVPSP